MKLKICIAISLILWISSSCVYAQSKSFTTEDLKLMAGEWKGSLTYLDYSSKKSYSMPADVSIEYLQQSNLLIYTNRYPDEPKANNKDTAYISKNGKRIDEERVIKKSVLPDENIEIVTEYSGNDGNDNKPAIIRHTYTLGKQILKKTKEVMFKGGKEWIKRNEFSYTRN